MPARRRAAEPSGSSGSSTSSPPSAEAFDWSTPAFAHTKPWWVTQIERAVDGPAAPRPTRRAPPARGARPCGAPPRARGPRSPGSISSRRRTRPSAFETTLCATTSDVAVAEVLRCGRRDQAGEVVAGSDRRQRSERADAERGQAEACAAGAVHAPARSSWRSAPRVEGAWPRRPSSAARRARRGRRACPRRARGRAPPRRGAAPAPPAAAAMWRAKLSGPNAGLDRIRRREHERVRAGAVTIGDDHHSARRRR